MRFAIYYAPDGHDPLAALGARWLGRDMVSGHSLQQPIVGGVPQDRVALITRDPRRYGFHGTLKAPFRLAEGARKTDLLAHFDAFAASQAPQPVAGLIVAHLDAFLALVPTAPAPGLTALAAAAVESFDAFRAPPDEAEIARRRPERLSERQRALLDKWGYPYVFEEFRFHMTLSGTLTDAVEAETLAAAARAFFQPITHKPRTLSTIALCVEPEPGAPFTVERLRRLGDSDTGHDATPATAHG